MDKKALNYDETAVEDDGSCEYKDKDKKLSKRQVRKIGKGRQRDFIDIELEKLGDGKFSIKKFQNDYKRQEDDIQVVFDIIEELLKTHAIVAKVRTYLNSFFHSKFVITYKPFVHHFYIFNISTRS